MFDATASAAVFGPLFLLLPVLALIWMNRDRRVPALVAGLLVVLAGLGLLSEFAGDIGLPAWRPALVVFGERMILWIGLLALVLPWLATGPSRTASSRALGWTLAALAAIIVAAALALSGLRFT